MANNTLVEQAEGVVRYPMAQGLPFDFIPNEGTLVEGTVKRANDTKIKAGSYKTAENLLIIVKDDGKASIQEPSAEGEGITEKKEATAAKKAEIKAIATEHRVKELFENSKGEYFTSYHLALNSEGNKKDLVKTHKIED